MKKLIFSLAVFSLCICFEEAYAYSGQLPSLVNPFLNKVLCIKTQYEISPEIFAKIKIDMPNAKNGLTLTSKVFDNGNAIRVRQEFDLDNETKNIRDLYAKNNTVVCINSISPYILEINNINKEDEFGVLGIRNVLFDVYEKIKNIESTKDAQITGSGDILTISWQDQYAHNATINLKTKTVEEYVVRKLNGDLYKKLEFDKVDLDSWRVLLKLYNPNNVLFATHTLQVSAIEDNAFANDLEPKEFGFREVIDTRNNQERKYIAVDKLPSDKFIDELFKNPDDVKQYNVEMSRFAPIEYKSRTKKK